MTKRFKGYIVPKRKILIPQEFIKDADELYGKTLGFAYSCTFLNHPVFGNTTGKIGARTSLVVSERKLKNGDIRVETLNSIYRIKKKDAQGYVDFQE